MEDSKGKDELRLWEEGLQEKTQVKLDAGLRSDSSEEGRETAWRCSNGWEGKNTGERNLFCRMRTTHERDLLADEEAAGGYAESSKT